MLRPLELHKFLDDHNSEAHQKFMGEGSWIMPQCVTPPLRRRTQSQIQHLNYKYN